MTRHALVAATCASLTLVSWGCASTRPGNGPVATPAASAPGTRWTLSWSDEFDGPAGARVDPARWFTATGGHGWGNNELQTYTDRAENASLSGDGQLVIRALREHYQGADGLAREYTSARLKTQGRFEQMYGRFEARLQLPRGQGLWPAFWMMGANLNAVGWPQAGELDIMENIGKEPAIVHGTIHGPGYSGADSISGAYTLPGGAAVADAFHVFAVEWEPAVIRFYVDDTLFATRTPADLKPGQAWVFDHPFFLLLNVAVGGNWPGNPDATTVFPQTMRVDYVRVYTAARP
jgi:beta-glucanase (GH16 family)